MSLHTWDARRACIANVWIYEYSSIPDTRRWPSSQRNLFRSSNYCDILENLLSPRHEFLTNFIKLGLRDKFDIKKKKLHQTSIVLLKYNYTFLRNFKIERFKIESNIILTGMYTSSYTSFWGDWLKPKKDLSEITDKIVNAKQLLCRDALSPLKWENFKWFRWRLLYPPSFSRKTIGTSFPLYAFSLSFTLSPHK